MRVVPVGPLPALSAGRPDPLPSKEGAAGDDNEVTGTQRETNDPPTQTAGTDGAPGDRLDGQLHGLRHRLAGRARLGRALAGEKKYDEAMSWDDKVVASADAPAQFKNIAQNDKSRFQQMAKQK